ncbi:hypothetical protein HAX54_025954 [Datura stramonium]|uniref:Uncharacterized protein ycf68 n=1 Tax=Datura stramonium TaxID=4076 RepID=A0ABS8V0M0_DATST|nr:hypothetical protein [Datura stramonium]
MGAIRVRSNVDPTFRGPRGIQAVRGTTTAPLFSRINTSLISVWTAISPKHRFRFQPQCENKMEHLTHLHRPRTTEITLSFWGDGGIVPFEPFFLDSKSKWEQTCQEVRKKGGNKHLEERGWMSNCPGGNDSILYLNRWLAPQLESADLPGFPHLRPLGKRIKLALANSDALSPFNPWSEMRQKKGRKIHGPAYLHPCGVSRSPQGRLRHPGVTDRP